MKNYFLCIATFAFLISSCGIANNNLKFRSVSGKERRTTLATEPSSPSQNNPLVESSQKVNEIITMHKDVPQEVSIATIDQDFSLNNVERKVTYEIFQKKSEKPKSSQDDPKKNFKRAKNALIMGKLSFIPVIGWIFAVFAFILGGIAINRIKKDPETNDGLYEAKEGIRKAAISTIIGAAICLAVFLFFVIAFTL